RFIDKRLIRAAAGFYILGRLDETISAEIDVPAALRRCFCDLLRFLYGLAGARLLVWQPHGKPVRHAFGSETNQSLVRIAFFEMPYAPRVEREDFFFYDPSEFRLATTFQLDKVL